MITCQKCGARFATLYAPHCPNPACEDYNVHAIYSKKPPTQRTKSEIAEMLDSEGLL